MKKLSLALCLPLSFVAAGCGGGGSSGGAPAAPEEFCASVGNAFIDAFARCQGVPRSVVEAQFGTPSATSADCQDFKRSVEAKRSSYDPLQGGGCISAIQQAACDSLFGDGFPAACDKAIVGQVAAGGACYDDTDCATTLCDVSACPGKCVALIKAGQSCAGPTDQCERGFDCAGGICKARGDANAACEGQSDPSCKSGLYCAPSSSGTGSGTCMAPKAAGATCTSDVECASSLRCSAGKCEAPRKVGDACTQAGSECGDFLFCGADMKCAAPTFGKAGDSCGASGASIAYCTSGAYCDFTTSKCVAQKKAGEDCADFSECGDRLQCDPTSMKCVTDGCYPP